MEDSTPNANRIKNTSNSSKNTSEKTSISSNILHEKWKQKHVVNNPVICGIGAGWVNIFITFPINKFSFRQQVESTNPERAWLNLKSYFSQHGSFRNLNYIYRGCSIPLVQKALANSIMYGSYSHTRNYIGNQFDYINPFAVRGLACLTAGSIEAVICTPLERCQAVLQDRRHDSKFRGLKDVLNWHFTRRNLSVGVKSLYSGGAMIVFRNTVTTFNYFMIRDWYKNNIDKEPDMSKHVIFGMLSGATGCTISYPINTVKNKIQTNLNARSVYQTIRDTSKKNAEGLENLKLENIETSEFLVQNLGPG